MKTRYTQGAKMGYFCDTHKEVYGRLIEHDTEKGYMDGAGVYWPEFKEVKHG